HPAAALDDQIQHGRGRLDRLSRIVTRVIRLVVLPGRAAATQIFLGQRDILETAGHPAQVASHTRGDRVHGHAAEGRVNFPFGRVLVGEFVDVSLARAAGLHQAVDAVHKALTFDREKFHDAFPSALRTATPARQMARRMAFSSFVPGPGIDRAPNASRRAFTAASSSGAPVCSSMIRANVLIPMPRMTLGMRWLMAWAAWSAPAVGCDFKVAHLPLWRLLCQPA